MNEMMVSEEIEAELMKGERILWVGQPGGSLFSAGDIFMVPFSLMWGGFALFWESRVLGLSNLGKDGQHHSASLFMAFFGIPFVLIGLYMIFGRFIYRSWIKNRTWYAVTDRRAVVVIRGFIRTVQAGELKLLPSAIKSQGSGGRGSILFGSAPLGAGMYLNSGMDFAGKAAGNMLAFFDIEDVDQVYELIQNQPTEN